MELRIFTEPQQGASYADLLAVALAAESGGFGAFFRSDHYLKMGDGTGLPGPSDAWITLAGLARDTTTIRLGTLVSPVTFRLPGPLAISVANVDDMSAGRVELGLGTGWFDEEHRAYGIPYPAAAGERFDLLTEQLAIIKTLEENYIFNRQDAKLSLQQLKRDTKKIDEPRGRDAGKPADVGFLTDSLRRQAELLRKAKTPEGIHTLYRRALEDHATDVAAFKGLARDYFAAFGPAPEDQRKAIRQIESQFERRVDTGSTGYFDVMSANSVRQIIVGMYRQTGEESRAAQLEKKSGKIEEKAKRNAL